MAGNPWSADFHVAEHAGLAATWHMTELRSIFNQLAIRPADAGVHEFFWKYEGGKELRFQWQPIGTVMITHGAWLGEQ